ncbi:hypothetical protein M758_7G097600 [Ceratodon purpureus]|nr:hypothetical protein M758_7G097600 [Ceratodon purpureus]
MEEAGNPNLVEDKLVIDLSQDLLSVSSTGYVIRTSCSGGQRLPCALKRIDVEGNSVSDLVRLEHPHVVQLIHYWIEERYLFLIMELMDGDLAKLMARTKKARACPFSLHVTVDLMLQIAKGMLYLHEMGVSHPHLKCENILYRAVSKSEAYQVGDVLIKLGGFGCTKPANINSRNRDVLCFGRTCLEILTGDNRADKVSRSSIPETMPTILKDCIVSCLDTHTTFADVVMVLTRAKSYILQTCKDEMMFFSEDIETKIAPTKIDDGLDEIFAVHQLHPHAGDLSTSVRATLIFFHGFYKVPEEWRRTWMTRDNKFVWPQKWLPEDLGAGNIRVLSVSFDAKSNVSNNYNRSEFGQKLLQKLVLSRTWKLGETGEAIFLVGHSFGGVLIKSLVTKAQNIITERVQENIDEKVEKCEKFLKSLAMIVFFSVPHAPMGLEFENYISECREIVALQRSSFLHSLREDISFIADMNQLSADFAIALSEKVKVLAFLEGKPMKMKRVLVTEKPFEGLSQWEWHKIDEDNHFEVCRPNSKNHIGYKILVDNLQQQMDARCSLASTEVEGCDPLNPLVSPIVGIEDKDEPQNIGKFQEFREPKDVLQKFASEPVSGTGSSQDKEFPPSGTLSGLLRSFHRGTAIRMLTDYLSDLTDLNNPPDEKITRRIEENRAILEDLREANQQEPNSPLTSQERKKLILMLKDYQIALSVASEDEDEDNEVEEEQQQQQQQQFVADVEFKTEKAVTDDVPLTKSEARLQSEKFVDALTSALELCERQVGEFKQLLLVVRVFHHQCKSLVETLEPIAEKHFERCHKVLEALKGSLEVDGDRVPTGGVHFCFESLLELACSFRFVGDLLRKCASENLHRTALELANLPPQPKMPKRWSEFSLAIRNCEWIMDLVEFALYALEKLLVGDSPILDDVSLEWCEEKFRMVLRIPGMLGRLSSRLEKLEFQGSRLEKLVIDDSKELEKKDMENLLEQLRQLGESADSGSVWTLTGDLTSPAHNRAQMVEFIMQKLSGPIPRAGYLPWTFRVEPDTLKFREYLDSGGAGMVRKYTWYGENVAVKNVRSPGLTRNKFESEAGILATVQHPNVVRLIGCSFINKKPATGMLIMELMDHDLRTVIETRSKKRLGAGSGPFTTLVAIDIIMQIGQAMKHLRDHKVLHGDLKAKNVLVNINAPLNQLGNSSSSSNAYPEDESAVLPHTQDNYVVKLAGFGMANFRPNTPWVRTRMAGTTGLRAPEVFHVQDTEDFQQYRWPADVYSFGMTCYEILTGNLPFANSPTQTMHESVLAGKRPEGLDELAIPELLKNLVKQCWATDPGKRPTFDEIVKSLWECRVQAISLDFEISVSRRPSSTILERPASISKVASTPSGCRNLF